MDEIHDILLKRHLLLSVRMRFLPEVQPIRETAIDRIVERILVTAPEGTCYSVQEVQRLFSDNAGFHIIYSDIDHSLQRLAEKGRAESTPEVLAGGKVKVKGKKKKFYKLSTDTRKQLEELERESTRHFDSVVQRLFKNSKVKPSAYSIPFLKFLSLVFSRLAEEYIQMLKGDVSSDDLISSPIFSSALNAIKNEHRSLDLSLFESAAISFFRDNDPEYAAIKWNMSQNYYILRIIGVDKEFSLLSKEIFENVVFYLDTNVVISALAPEEAYHAGFVAFSAACEKLGAKIRVCKITLDELDRVIMSNRDMLQSVIDQIPDETAVKVHSDFFEAYYDRKKSGQEFDLDEVFANFVSAKDKLRELFEIEIEDDIWFEEAKNNAGVSDFANVVAARYASMRPRRKGDLVAAHDSMCLLWVEESRQRNGTNNIWFATRDYTLPYCVPPDCDWKSLAIGLDALLQWLSPIMVGDGEEKDIALAYSAMISSRILPQERIFNMEDFLIFHELGMSCKELPAEDVEGCIRYIKTNAPLLNPTDPADREKLAHALATYFVDPSRKYKQNLQRYEATVLEMTGDLKKEKKQSLRKGAWLRVSHIVILFLSLEIIAVLIASNYGAGANIFQRIINSWPFLAAVVPICGVIGCFYIGRERSKALGWPITKIFKHE